MPYVTHVRLRNEKKKNSSPPAGIAIARVRRGREDGGPDDSTLLMLNDAG